MNTPGYNPLRWDCDVDGCFNQKKRPKIELFADCFSGQNNFGDVDGIIERNGRFCMLEWKPSDGDAATAQRISFEQFTRAHGNAVFVVCGDPEAMTVTRWRLFWGGRRHSWHPGPLSVVKVKLSAWWRWANAQPRRIR